MPPEHATVPRRYDFYGHATESDFPYRATLAPARGATVLTIRAQDERPPPPAASHALYVSPALDAGGAPRLVISRQDTATRLVFGTTLDVHLERRAIRYRTGDDVAGAEIYLLGVTAAYWLETRGIAALHGAAVAVDGRGVAILGGNGSGKSTLAIAMMKSGAALVSDDLLPVSIDVGARVAPGPPRLRLWPAQARELLGVEEGLARAHPALEKRIVPLVRIPGARHAASGAPLSAIVLPVRGAPEIVVTRLHGAQAAMALVGTSFLAPLAPHAPWRDSHLSRLARLSERVPVFRLEYPNGLDHLPALCERLGSLLRG